ncbi:MAG: desulfoferrodoxin [Bacteroidaceae bacterium]|nr:desulfoferrodoxin [Bacteroidaceae bacterium]
MAIRFFRCRHCGNIIVKMVDSRVPVVCCGERMEELVANTVEASTEKHIPHITRIDDSRFKVEIGSIEHPMLPEHHIVFIFLETENGGMFFYPKNKPETIFCTDTGKPLAVYEYCNVHGLWKAKI